MNKEPIQSNIGHDVRHSIIIGFPRSGTTLLRRLLDAHPQISCPPEPWLTTACARFIRETPANGIPIGVMTGLGFSGIRREDIFDPLRKMMFGFHDRMAGKKPIRIEKSGFDIFYLDELEQLFADHCRFICMTRHPLDVIPSVKTLCDRMGCHPPELRPYLCGNHGILDAICEAWIERSEALNGFMARNGTQLYLLRFEDLLSKPLETVNLLLRFLGAEPVNDDDLTRAAHDDLRIGLGDWKVYETNGIQLGPVGTWKGKLPREFVSRALPRLTNLMEGYGYDRPSLPRAVDHANAIRQFNMAMALKRSKPRNSR